MTVEENNPKSGVLGRKLELLSRSNKANADEPIRLARKLGSAHSPELPPS